MLEVTDLTVRYGPHMTALDHCSLSCPASGVVAVLGSNGAGKTTLMRAISGVLDHHGGRVAGGRITFRGETITGRDPAWIVGSGVVQVPEGRRVFAGMTVEDNLRAGAVRAGSRSVRAQAYDRVHALFPVLAERRDQRAGLLSGGEQQMLAIGRGLMSEPDMLLLDEPSLGLAPKMVEHIGRVVTEIRAQGTAVLLVEQNAAMALSIADHAYVMEAGTVALEGDAADLEASDEVRARYLGDPRGPEPTTTGRGRSLSVWVP
ncbi:ABC transporter ATP-binding protein [Actinomadura spongiicola]|uniref:ABC transporter ATP-binding protein n=1 Tax=Actinomadura spongiicola TaxID=2303421 RepID=A0A372GA79_9ACTN|nr:ABC transporter ATP-binding protein [Actinomadura spongiicola]RFS81983.1 ABC transporter ATP-binding protein [Actinomadura spongiicola]